ncbi:MAG: hypothetical protein KGD58_11965 [Candidatus Lokiarchaeota archaeon]|nr:hypothetical protein [Candidatus Lokiarchaeota archaeon]
MRADEKEGRSLSEKFIIYIIACCICGLIGGIVLSIIGDIRMFGFGFLVGFLTPTALYIFYLLRC